MHRIFTTSVADVYPHYVTKVERKGRTRFCEPERAIQAHAPSRCSGLLDLVQGCPAASRQNEAVLGHIGLNVPDLELARRYYSDLLPRVGFEVFVDDADQFAFMPADGKRGTFLFFYPTRAQEPYSRHDTTGLQHLAFMVRSRSAVDEIHGWARSIGSSVLHAPREFPEYPPPYYATFWLDPFGLMLEAVCHHDRD